MAMTVKRPCSFCNKCLFNLLENPLGCYDERRYASREEMLAEIYSVYDAPPFRAAAASGLAAEHVPSGHLGA